VTDPGDVMMDDAPRGFHCPLPEGRVGEQITLAHGEGGRLMRRLIQETVLPAVANPYLSALGTPLCCRRAGCRWR